jgi:hypothetical protein
VRHTPALGDLRVYRSGLARAPHPPRSGPIGRRCRSSSHGRSRSKPQASMPASRRRPPFPWGGREPEPRPGSRSRSLSVSASWIRSPASDRRDHRRERSPRRALPRTCPSYGVERGSR